MSAPQAPSSRRRPRPRHHPQYALTAQPRIDLVGSRACTAGWSGIPCEDNVHGATYPCQNGAACVDAVDAYSHVSRATWRALRRGRGRVPTPCAAGRARVVDECQARDGCVRVNALLDGTENTVMWTWTSAFHRRAATVQRATTSPA